MSVCAVTPLSLRSYLLAMHAGIVGINNSIRDLKNSRKVDNTSVNDNCYEGNILGNTINSSSQGTKQLILE